MLIKKVPHKKFTIFCACKEKRFFFLFFPHVSIWPPLPTHPPCQQLTTPPTQLFADIILERSPTKYTIRFFRANTFPRGEYSKLHMFNTGSIKGTISHQFFIQSFCFLFLMLLKTFLRSID